ncbi:hypothetical protein FRC00_013146, partial [Tulasnella sp. 408]
AEVEMEVTPTPPSDEADVEMEDTPNPPSDEEVLQTLEFVYPNEEIITWEQAIEQAFKVAADSTEPRSFREADRLFDSPFSSLRYLQSSNCCV